MVLVDSYGRPLTHARISITSRCMYRCVYCHREGLENPRDALTIEDFEILAHVFKLAEIKFVKLTGGEPLARNDVVDVCHVFREVMGRDLELSIVTNGYLLEDYLPRLVNYIDRINVSLPSLDRDRYRMITGVDGLDKVLRGLRLAREMGLRIKINVVVTKLNLDEIPRIIEFCRVNGIDANIIELLPLGIDGDTFRSLYASLDGLEEHLRRAASRYEVRDFHARPVYVLPEGVRIEVIRSIHNPSMCAHCTRIRVTPDGYFKTCLRRSNDLVPFIDVLRSELSVEEKIRGVFERLVLANRMRRPYAQRSV